MNGGPAGGGGGGVADLGKDVVLVLQHEAAFSVIFVPVQLHDQRLLVQV